MTYPVTIFVLAVSLVAIAGLGGCTYFSNRFYVPPEVESGDTEGKARVVAGAELSVITWNIGYAGMGKESDFVMDKGTQRRPLNDRLVDKNLNGIKDQLDLMNADVFLLQEVALPSWSTYGRDVLSALKRQFEGFESTFGADINTRFVPAPFKVQIGNAIFSGLTVANVERRGLPLEPTFELGMFRKGYRMHVLRLAGPQSWVIVNLHLSTFDSEDANVRAQQVSAVLQFAQQEYELGHRVIVGGDWNLRLVDVEFPDTTPSKYKFWVRDFPRALIPTAWNLVADHKIPTVRGAHQPFIPGDNFTLVIDGFLTSPNVRTRSVQTENLGFEFSDHNPVRAVFSAE